MAVVTYEKLVYDRKSKEEKVTDFIPGLRSKLQERRKMYSILSLLANKVYYNMTKNSVLIFLATMIVICGDAKLRGSLNSLISTSSAKSQLLNDFCMLTTYIYLSSSDKNLTNRQIALDNVKVLSVLFN